MSARNSSLPGAMTLLVVVGWLLLVVVANLKGAFLTGPDRLPIALLGAIAGPILLFVIAYKWSGRFRAYVLTFDLRLLTAIQCWRILGGMFLAFHAYRLLPGVFAYPAGYGDILVGLLAPFVLMKVLREDKNWPQSVLMLNVLGLLDFLAAVGTGLLASSGPLGLLRGEVSTQILQQMPVSLVPTFAVPFWIIVHLMSLLQLQQHGHAPRDSIPSLTH